MSEKFILKDFEEWKNLNKHISFSLYDYLYQQMTLNHVNTDIFFAFQELFWPTFITYKSHVFVKELFSEYKYKELENQNDDKMIEYWMNLLTIDSYFENDEDGDEKSIALSKKLVDIWEMKLKKDFPNLDFVVEYVYDTEMGDYGLTFYQKK